MGNTQAKEEIIIKCEIGDMVKQFFKDSVIIWHDPNIESQENKPFIAQLESFCQVKAFTQFEEALAYVKQAKETCHVITSAEMDLSEICSAPNVYGVYVLVGKIQDDLLKNSSKILHAEANIHKLLFKVEQNLLKSYEEKASSRFSFAPIFNETDKRKLNTLHMYLTVIPAFQDRSQAKTDFLTLCKILYSDEKNFDFLINLTQNYNEYDLITLLNWYTQDSLFSKVINTCLRISSLDSLQYCRLPIQDMQKAIHDQYQRRSKNLSGLLYKAAELTFEEWSNLKENLNKEIETLGFFSTLKDRKIALNEMETKPDQKVFVTILVPKGPNEEEYGFADIEFKDRPHQVIFNTMSRFTILEATEQPSHEIPYRHLVLLYGAQGFRKHLAEENLTETISVDNKTPISCNICHSDVLQNSSKFFFKSFVNQNHYCQKCLFKIPKTNDTAFLCIPVSTTDDKFTVSIKGSPLTLPPNVQIPFYGYQCCFCQNNYKAKVYLKCTECSEKWCENCIDKTENCMKLGHSIIMEKAPFSFWQESMSESELKELQVEKENMPKEDNPDKQAEMFEKTNQEEKSLDYYLRLLKVVEKNKKSNPSLELLNVYQKIAKSYSRQKDYAKAFQYELEVFRVSQLLGPQELDRLNIPLLVVNITRKYYSLGEYTKAEEYCLKGIEISSLAKEKNHLYLIEFYETLGGIYLAQGRYEKSLENLFKARELLQENSSDLRLNSTNLGRNYLNLGDYKKAEEYCLEALSIHQSMPGENSQDYLPSCYYALGRISSDQKNFEKGLEYSLKALEVSRGDHPEREAHYNSVGYAYQNKGDYTKALEFHSKALKENKEPSRETYIYLGQVYCFRGEYSKALEHCFKALEVSKENPKQDGYFYSVLAHIYEKKGEYQLALENYLKAQEDFQTSRGNNHPYLGECHCDLGNVYNRLGEYEKALEYHFRSLLIAEAAFGANSNHPNLAECFSGLGQVYCSKKDYKAAMNYHLRSLKIRKEAHGENHPDVAACFVDMGDVHQGEGDDEKAKECYLKALEIRKSMLGEEHPETIALQEKLVSVSKLKENQEETEI